MKFLFPLSRYNDGSGKYATRASAGVCVYIDADLTVCASLHGPMEREVVCKGGRASRPDI